MIKICNYKSEEYPLHVNTYNQLPDYVTKLLKDGCYQFDIIIRGGLAYVLHSKDFSYPLKDIDLAINKVHRDVVINYFNKEGYVGYLNQNRFGMEVITLFWTVDTYFDKVDILLTEGDLPSVSMQIPGYSIECNVMSIMPLLKDRLKKIIERIKRGHDIDKTYKHVQVVKKICENNVMNFKSSLEKEEYLCLFLAAKLEIDNMFPEEAESFNTILSIMED